MSQNNNTNTSLINHEIRIQTKLTTDGSAAEINILDNGPGFSPKITDKLFDLYFTTKPTGMGMGLAICRTIIEKHGGYLSAKPNPDGGAWFQFTLPIAHD